MIEADRIVTEELSSVLSKRKITSDIVLKQYIYYSENLDKIRDIISSKFPEMDYRKIDSQSEMYIGNFLITISTVNRQLSAKLGYIGLDIVLEIINHSDINQDSIKKIVDSVLSKIEPIESIERVSMQKVYRINILLPIIMAIAILSIFVIYIHLFWLNIFKDYAMTLAFLTISISIGGLIVTSLYSLMHRRDIVIK